jgi:AGCS family alanine or glycine:cation symporter
VLKILRGNKGKMSEKIASINSVVNSFIWGVPAMICIIGVGILLTVRTRCIQVRKFGVAMKNTIGKIFDKTQARDGSMSPFQAVCTALAGTVGTGNIAGVAGAIALGGPGAIFWMWCSAFLGMCTKFSEVTLAIHFREKNKNGEYVGGPMYYIKNGLSKKWHFLAVFYAVFGVLTVFGTGNATQVNTIVSSVNTALMNFNILKGEPNGNVNLIFGIFIAALVAMVLLGGIKRIGQVSEKLVPFMAVLYVILALGVIILNIQRVPGVFAQIVSGAFTPRAATGGIIGSMFLSMKKGVSRGIFSNEAGLGTGSIAHACADTDNAVHQGMFGIFEVFMDTIVICTLTGLVILLAAPNISYGQAAGAELTISGFTATYGGWVSILTAIAMCCFAFSTIIGWGLYGSRCIEFLGGEKFVRPFLVVYSFVSIVGATMNLGLLWDISDTFNGLMAVPNLIALLMLSGHVKKLAIEVDQAEKDGTI